MANIKFKLRNSVKTTKASIYMRMTEGASIDITISTGYTIDPVNWNSSNGLPYSKNHILKRLAIELGKLKNYVLEQHLLNIEKAVFIDKKWVYEQIEFFKTGHIKRDENKLTNYFELYINNLSNKVHNGTIGIAKRTITNYKVALGKVKEFETVKRKKYYVKDVDVEFIKEFNAYFLTKCQYSINYIGSVIAKIKTICNDAKANGVQTSPQLALVKGFGENSLFTTLSFEELDKIKQVSLLKESLDNARDWLIIGCAIGQRGDDLLKLSEENIENKNNAYYISLIQKKTGKKVYINIDNEVMCILKKREMKFPRKISMQTFNVLIKEIAKQAGLTQKMKGSIRGKENRIIKGIYPNYQLVTSHICRRSFSSNHYGHISTPVIMNITGHSKESTFLKYVNKSPIELANQFSNEKKEFDKRRGLK